MTIITEISLFMLPTKLQSIYDYIHSHKSNNDLKISYDEFIKFMSQLHLVPNNNNNTIHLATPSTNPNNNDDSELLHHIFSTYQQTAQSKHINKNKGEHWLQILSKLNNGCSIYSEKFIKAITDCNIQSMTASTTNTISRPRSGFSSKLLSPKPSLTKTKSYDKSDTNSINMIENEDDMYEISTDSDLDDEQFGILKKLPTWKKLKLSVYERRQRWKRKQKTKQRLKEEEEKQKQQQQQTEALESIKQNHSQAMENNNDNDIKCDNSIEESKTINKAVFTYSDLDFSSTDDDFDDIIKGPSPPPRKMMSVELKAMCGNLINELLSSPRSFYFRDYFPFHKWGLIDYDDYFPKNYSHLNIVKNNLENDQYETPGLFAADIRTIFNNATLYHWEGSKQYRIKAKAMLLLDEFEEKYLDILAEDEVSQKIRQELIHSMQQKEQREEKRERKKSSASNRYNSSNDSDTGDYSGVSDGDIDDESSDEYSILSKTNLTHKQQSSVIANTSITMNSIPEQKRQSTDGDEISEMMKTLQQLTDVTDVQTMKETNDYINNIRLDLMIAQKISKESPRLQKMRFLKQLHGLQLLMENKRRDMISYTTMTNNMRSHNKSVTENDKLYVQSKTSVRNTFFPDEDYNYNKYAWNRCKNSSIDSRGSQTFIRAHDLSIRYAINFPKSITIKANKRRKSGSSLSYKHDGDIIDDSCTFQKTVSSESTLNEVENETEEDIEFEQLPTEMTDEKLIEEHTDDLWAAMPLVPVEILQKSVKHDGVTFVESENIVRNDLNAAQHLLTDQYFAYTYSYVKTQFMTHFGKLRVGRDIFVAKLHHIFDSHKEFKWLRLNLPNYYVTPKSIISMECMKDIQMNEKRNKLYGLLQILQPNTQNMSPIQIIYQHKLYLYELLKLSGVIRIAEDPPVSIDLCNEFILCLDELWELTDDNCFSDNDIKDMADGLSKQRSAPIPDSPAPHPLIYMTKSKSKPGSTPTVHHAFSFDSYQDMIPHEINPSDLYDNDVVISSGNIEETMDKKSYESVIKPAQHLIPMIDSESDCEYKDEPIIFIPSDTNQYAQQNAMNENYAGNHHGDGTTSNNNNNNNNDAPEEKENNNANDNPGGQQPSGGDDGDEKKNNDNNTTDDSENKVDEEKKEEEQKENDDGVMEQDIQIVDAPVDENNNPRSRIDTLLKGLGVILAIILAIVFGSDFIGMDSEYNAEELGTLFHQAEDFLDVYDKELIRREKNGKNVVLYDDVIPEDNPSQTWINGLHIGSLVDALDIESKWYTGYVTNVDWKTGSVKIHYDDWGERFDEWVDPQSGKLAPYRTRAIGGRMQGGLPGRAALPIKPQNDTGLTAFNKMRIALLRQKKSIPDIAVTVISNKMKKYKDLFDDIFYEIGMVYNDRAVYMNHNKIYVFYMMDKDKNKWCIGTEYRKQQNTIICIQSDALTPELIQPSKQIDIKFQHSVFRPAYIYKSAKKFTPIGNKGLKNIPRVILNNKVMMPQVMVGTAGIPSKDVNNVISSAGKLGYYMFDTGTQSMYEPIYYNHKYINKLFKTYGRATIGISTKIPSFAHGYHSTIHSFISQLYTLGTDYIDLVVIEHPECRSPNNKQSIECEGDWLDTWRALEYLYEKKRIQAIGVSQFNMKQLSDVIKYKQKHIRLSVVRDWRDPLHANNNVLQWCNTNNIQFEAFSSLGGQHLAKNNGIINPVLNNPTIKRIATNTGMTSAQVVMKWNLQRGVGIVLKTSNVDHLSENLDAFMFNKLTDKELYDIDILGNQKLKNNNLKTKQETKPRLPRAQRRTRRVRNQQIQDEESVELQDDL